MVLQTAWKLHNFSVIIFFSQKFREINVFTNALWTKPWRNFLEWNFWLFQIIFREIGEIIKYVVLGT